MPYPMLYFNPNAPSITVAQTALHSDAFTLTHDLTSAAVEVLDSVETRINAALDLALSEGRVVTAINLKVCDIGSSETNPIRGESFFRIVLTSIGKGKQLYVKPPLSFFQYASTVMTVPLQVGWVDVATVNVNKFQPTGVITYSPMGESCEVLLSEAARHEMSTFCVEEMRSAISLLNEGVQAALDNAARKDKKVTGLSVGLVESGNRGLAFQAHVETALPPITIK
jgi:hypothetical protein